MTQFIKICKEGECKSAASTEGFCRYHFLKQWRRIKESEFPSLGLNWTTYINQKLKDLPNYESASRDSVKKKEGWHLEEISAYKIDDVFISFSNVINSQIDVDKLVDSFRSV
jgi:hypothetical protein